MFGQGQKAVLSVMTALTLLFASAVTWRMLHPPDQHLAYHKALPPFALTSQDGKNVTLDDFLGKVWLADFVYTTCPGPCPIITAHLASLQRDLPAGTQLVSISTDPNNDSPAVLKAYAAKFHAGSEWTFLTGPQDKVFDLIQHGFLLPIEAPKGAQIIHSTRIMLVDKSGAVRASYNGDNTVADAQIIADIKPLLQE